MIARTTTYHRPAARTSGAFNYRFVGDVMCPVTAPPPWHGLRGRSMTAW